MSDLSYGSDFSYEIRDPRADSAGDYLSTTNVTIKEESDFVYWYPSSAIGPNELVFHFQFDQTIKEADLYFRTDTFNWGYDAYTSIEASTDGINWITLKETGPPETIDGWNSGTYSGSLPAQLLGKKSFILKVHYPYTEMVCEEPVYMLKPFDIKNQ